MSLDRENRWQVLLFLFAGLLTGCYSIGDSNAFKQALITDSKLDSETKSLTVAVLPFVPIDSDGDESRHQIESFYFACEFTQTIRKNGFINAVYSPILPSAAAYIVSGRILTSEGKKTQVELSVAPFGGAAILTKKYQVELGYNDWSKSANPGSQLWVQPANDLVKLFHERYGADRAGIIERQLAVFGEGVNAKRSLPMRGLELERDKLLIPLSGAALGQARVIERVYSQWQRNVTRSQENAAYYSRRESIDLFTSVGAAVIAGASSAIEQNQGLNTSTSDIWKKNIEVAQTSAGFNAETAAVHEGSGTKLNEAFSQATSTLAVELEGQKVTLAGTMKEKIEQLHDAVRKRL